MEVSLSHVISSWRGCFFYNQIFKQSKPQVFPSPGDLGCGRPAQGEVELPWCLHPSLLLPGELQSIMIMILMFMVMRTTHDLRISFLSRYKWRLVYIVPNSSTPQVYVGGAPRTGNHGARPGSPPRLYQLVRIGIVGVLFSHFYWQQHLSRHHTVLFKFTKLKYFNNYWPQAPLPSNYVGCLRRVSG